MNLRMRHTAPAVIVAVALGAASTLLVASTGGSAADAKPSLAAVSNCKPVPARCGSEDNDLTIAVEAACQEYWIHAQAQTGVEPDVQDALTTIGFATAGVSRPTLCDAP